MKVVSDAPMLWFNVADTLGIQLTRDKTRTTQCVRGEARLAINVFDGLDWTTPVTVEDSALYVDEQHVVVLVHVCGALWLLLVVDGSATCFDPTYVVYVLDAAKISASALNGERTFKLRAPADWCEVARTLGPGIVAAYTRTEKNMKWRPYEWSAQLERWSATEPVGVEPKAQERVGYRRW